MLSYLIQNSGLFGQAIFSLIPPKNGDVAVTFHNLKSDEFAWFEEVIDLIESKYEFADPSMLTNRSDQAERSRRVLLTFDDGFRSTYMAAREILQPRKIHALIFVTREFVGLSGEDAKTFAQEHFYPKRELEITQKGEFDAMDWEEIRWLISQGHEIGGHTDTHPEVSTLSSNEKYLQIIESSHKLEQVIGQPIRQFAYPFGGISAMDGTSVRLAESRFDCAFSNIRGMIDESPNRYSIFRQNLVPGMPLWFVEAVIEGRVNWRYKNVRQEANRRFRNNHHQDKG